MRKRQSFLSLTLKRACAATRCVAFGVFRVLLSSFHLVVVYPDVSSGRSNLFLLSTFHPFTINQVSNDNLSFSGGSTVFTYDPRVGVTTLNPPSGEDRGGTDVVFAGYNFLNTSNIACRFGTTAVPAKFFSSEAILCTSPPNLNGMVLAEVTSNGVDFSLSGTAFFYFTRVTVESMWPRLGPASEGGTVVTIHGQGFERTSELSCAFGGVAGVETTWLTSTTLLCTSPPARPGLVPVRVTNNGVDFAPESLDFLYVNDAAVEDVKPRRVLETGQVPVFVRGFNFFNTTTLACRFGTIVVSGTFYTPELLVCMAPSHSAQSRLLRQVGRLSLEVSINGLDYTDSGKAVEYSNFSPPGHYARGWMPAASPNGTFSAGATDSNFTTCDPGSFQPSLGAERCLACPVGFICPGKLPCFFE